ncbi:MAG: hypothetical protein COB34_02635 [Methylophilaceae bacterium]|nr:MAG: hypothetical protein COB34_02635 [Methylophilaceae bacterium]
MFNQLRNLAKRIKKEFELYRLIYKHPDTPRMAKFLFGLAIGYLLLPFDLIPDFIPVLGQLDDVVIVPLLIYFALKLTPRAVVEYCRNNVN